MPENGTTNEQSIDSTATESFLLVTTTKHLVIVSELTSNQCQIWLKSFNFTERDKRGLCSIFHEQNVTNRSKTDEYTSRVKGGTFSVE